MYSKIKEMAEEALKLQNKNFMDETFLKIISICDGMEPLKATDLSEAALEESVEKIKKIVEATGIPLTIRQQLADAKLLASTSSGFSGSHLAVSGGVDARVKEMRALNLAGLPVVHLTNSPEAEVETAKPDATPKYSGLGFGPITKALIAEDASTDSEKISLADIMERRFQDGISEMMERQGVSDPNDLRCPEYMAPPPLYIGGDGSASVADYTASVSIPFSVDPELAAAVQSQAAAAGAYCETGDDKPRAPRGVKKGGVK